MNSKNINYKGDKMENDLLKEELLNSFFEIGSNANDIESDISIRRI